MPLLSMPLGGNVVLGVFGAPDGVLPSVPGIAPVGLSMPGARVDSPGRGGVGAELGFSGGLAEGGIVVPGAGTMPPPVPPPVPPVVPPPT
ncbi:MAG TPA: hypothetical protein VGR82_07235 [Methylomirabilota bacterium]|nr:hypothetical protein [Methylomirabilota bacterium]